MEKRDEDRKNKEKLKAGSLNFSFQISRTNNLKGGNGSIVVNKEYGPNSSSEDIDIPIPRNKMAEEAQRDDYKEKFKKEMPSYYRLLKKNIFEKKRKNQNSINLHRRDLSLPEVNRDYEVIDRVEDEGVLP